MENPKNLKSINAVKKSFDNAYNVFLDQLSINSKQVTELQNERQELLLEIQKMKLEKLEIEKMEKENSELKGQLQLTRKQLNEAVIQIEKLSERLCKERQRTTGWKKLAVRLNKSERIEDKIDQISEAKDLLDIKSNKQCLFLSPKRASHNVNIYALAPMTEQYEDSVAENNSDVVHITVEETEYHGQHCDVDFSDSIGFDNNDDSNITSPSILTRSSGTEPPTFFNPNSEIIEIENENGNFDTSHDLFADEASPLLTSTCVSNFKIPQAIDNSTPFKSLKHKTGDIEFAKSISRKNLGLNQESRPTTHNQKNIVSDAAMFLRSNETKTGIVKLHTMESKHTDKPYKYEEVIRKKSDREKLNGYTCPECMKYYKSDNLTKVQLEEMLKQCSRHRHKTAPPPSTPDDFWSTSFPTTQEYIAKGLMGVEKPKKSRKRIKYNN